MSAMDRGTHYYDLCGTVTVRGCERQKGDFFNAQETRTKEKSVAREMKGHQAHITQGKLRLRETALSSSTNREYYRRNLVTPHSQPG